MLPTIPTHQSRGEAPAGKYGGVDCGVATKRPPVRHQCTGTPQPPGPNQLQDVDDQEKHKSQHNDADENKLPYWLSATAVGELTPVPRIGIVRVGRHRAYRRRHEPSVGSAHLGAWS